MEQRAAEFLLSILRVRKGSPGPRYDGRAIRQKVGAEEIAQHINPLPPMHEDWSLDHQNLCKIRQVK